MLHSLRALLIANFLLAARSDLYGQVALAPDPNALVKKIQDELSRFPSDLGKPESKTPRGELLEGTIRDSNHYPGTENRFQVYVPVEYDPKHPACVLLKLDGLGSYEGTVLDGLIARKEVPVIIGVGISPGTVWKDPASAAGRRAVRFNRSYEFDSVNGTFAEFVLHELLPAVQKLRTRDGRAIALSSEGKDRAVMGASTGGIGSFTLAWQRPDQFSRVYSEIGTFVSMRGGHEYPALIRKVEPKPIRVFLEDGSADAWNPLFGSWYEANLSMESALTFAGYDVAHAWGNHSHDARPGQVILPDVLRWLWRDYPSPVRAGQSQNSTVQEIAIPDEGWRRIEHQFQGAAGLAANQKGEVYLSDPLGGTIYNLGSNGVKPVVWKPMSVAAQAFGPEGALYAAVPDTKQIVRLDPDGSSRTVARIAASSIVARNNGSLYASEPGAHVDMPSRIWRIDPNHDTKVMDQGLLAASGIAFSPDGSLFFAAENARNRVYSYVIRSDGTFSDREGFDWLHATDSPSDSGAEDLAVDTHGNLYVATHMGIQVCDQNGRVRAILQLPQPSGAVRSLCFGGANFDVLYATDGKQVFARRMKVQGVPPWSAPVSVPSQGPG